MPLGWPKTHQASPKQVHTEYIGDEDSAYLLQVLSLGVLRGEVLVFFALVSVGLSAV